PRVYAMYTVNELQLRIRDGLINHFFPNCPFSAQSLNLSLQSLASPHVDLKNLVFGLCCIIPLGHFNGETSAQLVLVEPKVIVELRPGDVFFFPSACIRHYSASLAKPEQETRQCMIMYTAGGLFRWVRQRHAL
ncbi:hypothetical protein BXZ70DRAFT_871029, partial [Cristinia sonorae]